MACCCPRYPSRTFRSTSFDSAARIHHQDATLTGKEARLTSHVTIAAFDFDQPIVEFAEIGDVAVLGSRWLGDFALTYDLTNGGVGLERLRRS